MQAPRESSGGHQPGLHIEWAVSPASLGKHHPPLLTLAQRFIELVPEAVTAPIEKLCIAPHEWIDDDDSETHLVVDLYLDSDGETALEATEQAADLIESLEEEVGLHVGRSVIMPHWPI